MAKGFDTSCPLSDFIPAAQVPDPHDLRLTLTVNGETRQNGTTADMAFPIATLISAASAIFTLEKGDILLTGTPAGVGPLQPGDQVDAAIEGLIRLEIGIH
jgi:2-keto-4-pentenoate hydratase/2-oxohepta-3-ene-1,7-dioic acid hydratase in catechol pathway